MQVSKPSYREKEAGGLCGKPQATLSCMLIKILPHQRVYYADTTRDEEVRKPYTHGRQTTDKITVLAC